MDGTRSGKPVRREGRAWRRIGRTALFAALGILSLKTCFQAYRIPSAAMEDTLLPGDFVLVDKLPFGARVPLTSIRLPPLGAVRPGDVLVFRYPLDPGRELIQRSVAGPGQTVEIRDKVLYVDGARAVDPRRSKYLDAQVLPKESPDGMRDNYGPVTVPPGCHFVLGDNRDNSEDSRFWGFLPADNVTARAIFVYFSWEPDPRAPAWEGLGSLPAVVTYNVPRLFSRARWDRVPRVVD